MLNQVTPIKFKNEIQQRLSSSIPLFLAACTDYIKLELKPYLQPFERELARRELRAIINPDDHFFENNGYFLVSTDISEEIIRGHLTYWQRVGRSYLQPTVQELLEFTQNGITSTLEKRELHNARRLRYGPHDLHEYRGKFFPQLVRSLINISGVPENARILDPMCGSGTTPCEALALGRSAIGADLNPLSFLISNVKSAIILENPSSFFEIVSTNLNNFQFKEIDPEKVWSYDDLRYLQLWFDATAINDLASILSEINDVQRVLYQDFFKVCLSNIIRSVSWQKDTDLRVRKEIKPYKPGTAISKFCDEVIGQLDRIYPYLCMLPNHTPQPDLLIRNGNAVTISDLFPEFIGKIDLLVTSPPYATALPYLDTDRLSLIVLGLLSRTNHKDTERKMVGTREVSERQRQVMWSYYLTRKNELPMRVTKLIDQVAEHNHNSMVGFRRRNLPALLGKYFLDMLDAMRSAHSLMRPGAFGYYVVGNNSSIVAGKKIEIPTNDFLFEIGVTAGWQKIELIPMELLASRDIFKENRGSSETILCFRA